MNRDALPLDTAGIRSTDSNSLLRMYDAARAAAGMSPSQQERDRANRALQRITRELQKRHLSP
jgi:hypothetical protein